MDRGQLLWILNVSGKVIVSANEKYERVCEMAMEVRYGVEGVRSLDCYFCRLCYSGFSFTVYGLVLVQGSRAWPYYAFVNITVISTGKRTGSSCKMDTNAILLSQTAPIVIASMYLRRGLFSINLYMFNKNIGLPTALPKLGSIHSVYFNF
ncbi:unnamed protein product [Vicia faba]|uniref:Uncharacterized protein n=1 Tax=Vicia faba TaxID=3906 RepID=A0AAV1A8D1_VICFA|nr:unnamed protein product [Vicia faba]